MKKSAVSILQTVFGGVLSGEVSEEEREESD